MNLEIVSKYRNFKENSIETVVTCLLSSDKGDTGTLTVICDGNFKDLPNDELIVKVKDRLYDGLFPSRAEKEAIANIKSEINTLKDEAIKEIKEETEKNRVMVRAVSQIVNQYLMLHAEELEDEEDDIGSNDDDERSEEENREETEGENSNDN